MPKETVTEVPDANNDMHTKSNTAGAELWESGQGSGINHVDTTSGDLWKNSPSQFSEIPNPSGAKVLTSEPYAGNNITPKGTHAEVESYTALPDDTQTLPLEKALSAYNKLSPKGQQLGTVDIANIVYAAGDPDHDRITALTQQINHVVEDLHKPKNHHHKHAHTALLSLGDGLKKVAAEGSQMGPRGVIFTDKGPVKVNDSEASQEAKQSITNLGQLSPPTITVANNNISPKSQGRDV